MTSVSFLVLAVLGLSLWIGGWMLFRPESYLRAKRERAGPLSGLVGRFNQPTPINVFMLRLTGAAIIGIGVFAVVTVLAR